MELLKVVWELIDLVQLLFLTLVLAVQAVQVVQVVQKVQVMVQLSRQKIILLMLGRLGKNISK